MFTFTGFLNTMLIITSATQFIHSTYLKNSVILGLGIDAKYFGLVLDAIELSFIYFLLRIELHNAQ